MRDKRVVAISHNTLQFVALVSDISLHIISHALAIKGPVNLRNALNQARYRIIGDQYSTICKTTTCN